MRYFLRQWFQNVVNLLNISVRGKDNKWKVFELIRIGKGKQNNDNLGFNKEFVQIIIQYKEENYVKFEKYNEKTHIVMEILDTVRKQAGIKF